MPVVNFLFETEVWGAPMVRYVLHILSRHPLAPEGLVLLENQEEAASVLTVGYGTGEGRLPFFIPRQALCFRPVALSSESWVANRYHFENRELYSVEAAPKAPQPFFGEGGRYGFDLIEAIFFHLSRYEEYHCPDSRKNEHGEMVEESHFLARQGLQRVPAADHLVFCFFAALGMQPKGLPTAFFLTHDVDHLRKFTSPWRLLRPAAKYLFFRPDRKALNRLLLSFALKIVGKAADPYDVFERMLQSGASGNKVLFLQAGGRSEYDGDYRLEHPAIKPLIRLAQQRGYQIGLHPSYDSWNDPRLFGQEIERLSRKLGCEPKYNRQHYLHFSHRHTPYILEAFGLETDSSLGYNQRTGFRCGTGFPYPPFSFEEQRPFHFLELPLVVMDSALLQEGAYRAEKVDSIWRDILDSNAMLTQLTFNFHNSRFDDAWLHGIPLEKYLKEVAHRL